MIDTHTEYGHGERLDHRRQFVPPSASHSTYDFRPTVGRKETSIWTVLLIAAMVPFVLFMAWGMTG